MPLYIIPQRYALRGATAAELAARNEVLLDREFCQETDTKRFKLGDGSTRWLDLPYAGWGGADLTGLAAGDVMAYDGSQFNATAHPTGFAYISDTGSTADSDPGEATFKWNHATQSSATVLYFDDLTDGVDMSTFYAWLATNSDNGFIHLVNAADASQWQLWKYSAIVDGTGYFKFTVAYQGGSVIDDNAPVRTVFHPMAVAGGGGGGSMVHVDTVTLGSAQSIIALSGLDLGTDEEYELRIAVKNATGSAANVNMTYNSDTTTTNYDEQRVLAAGTGNSAARANDPFAFGLPASATANIRVQIRKDLDGKASAFITSRENVTTSIQMRMGVHHYRTATNITGITLTSSVANAFASGCYIEIWKVLS